ncbi:hypothetical protein B6I21_02905 [candidate division KSB1 bacterium 4572_119]|nr:MAG: hypothetical protein B6I21_02905 [candidate division KSB1 bacterium 4572_119]
MLVYLPIGLYLVDENGYFQYCNEACKQILGISPKEDVTKIKIDDLYVNPEERRSLLEKMSSQNGRLTNQIIKFRRADNDAIIFIEDNCQQHQICSKSGDQCLVGSITDFTDIVRYRQLFNHLSAGVFRISSSHILVMANEAVAKIFGYNSTQDMLEIDVTKLWKNKADFEKYNHLLHKHGELKNYIAEMVKKDGQQIYISLNSKLWENGDGRIVGSEGTFTDCTNERKYVKAFERFSNGYYKVKRVKNKHIIFDCNNMFAKMHGYKNRDEVIGLDIVDFHYDKEKRISLFKDFEKAEKEKRTVFNKIKLQAKRKDGTPFWVQLDIELIPNIFGKIVEREGIVVDINERVLLQEKLKAEHLLVDKTIKDMDQFVHRYIAPIMNIDSTSQKLMEVLERRFVRKYNELLNVNIREQYLDGIIQNIDTFIEALNQKEKEIKSIKNLINNRDNLANIEKVQSDPDIIELRMREIIFDLLDDVNFLINKFETNTDSKMKLLHDARKRVIEASDVFILQLQRKVWDNTRITHNVIEGLRNYLFRGEEPKFDFSHANLINIIKNNIDLYYNMAKQKKLSIIPPKQNYVPLEISETNIDLMFSNLLLNAIKYSYKRSGGYITIKIFEKKNEIELQIDNYGVPVEKDELEKIFEYGYRGRKSYDWNRTGSGIGLADAKRTVKKHGGQIYLMSKPAGQVDREILRERFPPYITSVHVILPKRQEKK